MCRCRCAAGGQSQIRRRPSQKESNDGMVDNSQLSTLNSQLSTLNSQLSTDFQHEYWHCKFYNELSSCMMRDPYLTSRRSFFTPLFASIAAPFSCVQIANGGVAWNGADNSKNNDEKKIVCFFMDGGLSQIESFDPKPNAPASVRGEFGAIHTALPGVYFSEIWPRLAKVADRMTVIRSIHHRHNEHGFALQCMRTLQNDASRRTPALGSVIQWQSQSTMPVYVGLNDVLNYSGALGTNFRPFALEGPVGKQISAGRNSENGFEINTRMNLLAQLTMASPRGPLDARSRTLVGQQEKIGEILRSPVFQRILDTNTISPATRARYGETSIGEQVLLARNAVNEGMKFTIVNAPGWDMHSNLFAQCRQKVAAVDTAIAAFIEDLDASGQLDSTIVLVTTEFGRSPVVEGTGRGHWPHAMAVLAMGGPIPRGHVIGDTGPDGRESTGIRHAPDDLLASLYKWMNLEWEIMLPGENARLNTSGKAISELGFG